MVDKSILQNIDHAGYFERLRTQQARHLNSLLSFERIGRLIDAETVNTNYYAALSMLRDLRNGVWSEARTGTKVDIFRRNLQRTYLERMKFLMTADLDRNRSQLYYNVNTSDVRALVRGELQTLKRRLQSIKSGVSDSVTRYHYEDAIARINNLLEPK